MMGNEIKFIKGEEYTVILLPEQERVKGFYLGYDDVHHVFDSGNNYLLVDKHWAFIKEGVVTHHQFSGKPVSLCSKQDLVNILGESELRLEDQE